jgi:16S rRNA C967 or C1407 C5-methylase (RsmB/RsmF family)
VAVTRVGGRVVYSTCSLNPIENEAVVAAVLREHKGALQLEDAPRRALLPGLRRREGLTHWEVGDWVQGGPAGSGGGGGGGGGPSVRWHRGLEEAAGCAPKFAAKGGPLASMWPPTAEEATWMRLQRCLRLLPHDQVRDSTPITRCRTSG